MNFSNSVYFIWEIGLAETVMSKQEFIEPEHLLMGICSFDKIFHLFESNQINIETSTMKSIESEQQEIQSIFSKFDISLTSFRRLLRLNIEEGKFEEYGNVVHRSDYSKEIFKKAYQLAVNEGLSEFRAIHLLNIILKENIKSVNDTLELFEIEAKDLYNIIEEKNFEYNPNPNSILEKYGTNLTDLAKQGKLDPVIGMDDELLQLVRTLNKRGKNNALIVGEAGVGKSTLVRKLAQEIANQTLGENLNNKIILEVNMGSLVSGTKYRGEFEEKVNTLINEAKENPNYILFIDEAHTIIGTGSSGSLDASNMFKSALASGDLTVIGATTLEEYTLYFEKESAFERRFQPIMINEPSPEAVISILHNIKNKYEEFHNVKISDEAIEAAVKLSVRYIVDRNLPDKALDVIDEACSRKVIPKLNLSNDIVLDTYVTEHDVKAVISDWRCIPVIDYTFAVDKLANMETYLNERIVGQEEAVTKISNRIKKALLGIQDIERPLSVLMFVGSNGVGKTYAVSILSEFLFDSSRSYIRMDMSQYSESFSVTRLIGPPPGYKGNDEGGFLTNAIKNNPYSIIMIENIEKAHPQVVDVLLQLFETGNIVDSKNNKINANNCIFIITSEITDQRDTDDSYDVMYGAVGYDDEDNESEDLIRYYRRDLIDVIDDFIFFKELDENDYKTLVGYSLNALSNRVLIEKNIEITFTDDVRILLAEKGFNNKRGVNYLSHLIEKMVEFPFADLILNKEVQSGDEVIINVSDEELTFEVKV